MCPVPFHQWSFANGGREYRGVRTERYTYARDLRGPWLLFDNKQDPYQLNNLINNPGYSEIQKELDEELRGLLKKTGDEFRKAESFWMNPDFKAVRYEIRDLKITISHAGDAAWWFCMLDDINEWKGEPANWENTRWTGVLEKKEERWVIVQQHFSFAYK